ncbi:MAG: PIN domain-containing protein [Cyclobacteriaceae bacterium]|nr:PIN domain-containing protein [Cyclobacteriaceae bacterium]MDX5466738.1 PIN domain-containing protein [Cyclobacteriaceae bacterium]
MIHSVRFKAVLDTNVIYPLISRDLLFWFAHYELYTPKWSNHIFDEWKEVMLRKGLNHAEAEKRISVVNSAFPDALVKNYENLIPSLNLPDQKDRHVVAAAIKSNSNCIVTNNLKDFPQDILDNFEITVISADDFLVDIIDLNHDQAISAFKEMVLNRKNPKMDEFEILNQLRKCGLTKTADFLHSLI